MNDYWMVRPEIQDGCHHRIEFDMRLRGKVHLSGTTVHCKRKFGLNIFLEWSFAKYIVYVFVLTDSNPNKGLRPTIPLHQR
jgi:hypothetical protein